MDYFWAFLAALMPRRVVYYCIARAAGHATTGKWSAEELPELTVVDCMKRWEETL